MSIQKNKILNNYPKTKPKISVQKINFNNKTLKISIQKNKILNK